MSVRTFSLLASAEQEANDAFDWYQYEHFGLGDEFRIEVKLALKRIVFGPFHFALVHGLDIRLALTAFPFPSFLD